MCANHNAVCFNGCDGFLHLGVVRDLERMGTECVERVEFGEFQIDQVDQYPQLCMDVETPFDEEQKEEFARER